MPCRATSRAGFPSSLGGQKQKRSVAWRKSHAPPTFPSFLTRIPPWSFFLLSVSRLMLCFLSQAVGLTDYTRVKPQLPY
ncbi:hypothetical protein LY76DRAFT_101460 [Colletotrichum caudatum]|nr:hypothetical protein LY76DRAFT_101460 [Colletotrichum caudatum]